MTSNSRFARLLEMLSPEQRTQLGVVQVSLREDPNCLEKVKGREMVGVFVDELCVEEEKDA